MAEPTRRKITDYTPDPSNANRGTERGLRLLDDSIGEVGLGRSIVVDKHGTIIGGNKTAERAVDRGFEDAIEVETDGQQLVVVKRTDLDLSDGDDRARRLAYLDNRVGQLDLKWEPEQLLADLESGVDLSGMFSDDELEELLGDLMQEDALEDPGPQLDRAAELQEVWGTERGQVWEIGRHRLMCGDSTSAEDVGRLLGDNEPRLMVTDPPYGVEYEAGWREEIDGHHRESASVPNDNIIDWSLAWGLSPACVVYCYHAGIYAGATQNSLENSGFVIRSQIVWDKQHFVISRGHYHWEHEPCWYAVRDGAVAEWIGGRKQTTVWRIAGQNPAGQDRDEMEERLPHATQKPVECMARPIRNHAGDVYDPFLGSGTTMVAAEQLGRVCYGMEIEPKYVAVTLQRLADMGLEPRLVE
jgi:DNA modification methylase